MNTGDTTEDSDEEEVFRPPCFPASAVCPFHKIPLQARPKGILPFRSVLTDP